MQRRLVHDVGALLALVALFAPGCGDDGGATEAGGTTGNASTTTGDDGADAGTTSTVSDGVASSSSAGATSDADTGASETAAEPLPDGSSCSDNTECASQACYQAGLLGGFCGECLADADCPNGGCSIPNPFSTPPRGSLCNEGELGGGCETAEACSGELACAVVLNVPGVATVRTCSECEFDGDCGEELCSPVYDIANFTGSKQCVAPGSLPDGSGCDFEGTGDDACENFCFEANIEGLVTLGICNPCETAEHCGADEVCNPPTVTAEGVTPGGCAPA